MDADIKITEQIPVSRDPIQIPAQAGKITEEQNINIPLHCNSVELQQAGAVVKRQAAPYIAGTTNDFKAILFCVGFQSVPLFLQQLYAVWPVVSHTAINPSPFPFHYAASIQKSFIFQTIFT